jgi:hypothetical protein
MDENKHPSFLIWHFMDEHFVPYFMDEKSIPAFLFCILWMSFCALFYG